MTNQLKKKRVLITAGPTREWMDPVRFLSNPSSGAMGIAVAEELAKKKIHVTLVLGPTHLVPSGKIKIIRVSTALQMNAAVKKIKRVDAFVATAAVGDWRFARMASAKLKKSNAKTMTVELVKNPDIVAGAKAPVKIGFALESDNLKRNALKKLRAKNLDLIIANKPDSFSSDRIRPLWVERTGAVKQYPAMNKKSLARKIAQWLIGRWKH